MTKRIRITIENRRASDPPEVQRSVPWPDNFDTPPRVIFAEGRVAYAMGAYLSGNADDFAYLWAEPGHVLDLDHDENADGRSRELARQVIEDAMHEFDLSRDDCEPDRAGWNEVQARLAGLLSRAYQRNHDGKPGDVQ